MLLSSRVGRVVDRDFDKVKEGESYPVPEYSSQVMRMRMRGFLEGGVFT